MIELTRIEIGEEPFTLSFDTICLVSDFHTEASIRYLYSKNC